MPAASRHAKPKASANRFRAPIAAVVTLAGVATAFVFLHNGGAAAQPARREPAAAAAASSATASTLTADRMAADRVMANAVRRDGARQAARMAARARAAARRRHRAALAAARKAQRAQQAAAAAATPPPAPTPSPTTAPPSSGGDAADSALGVCVRDAEEGGSYAWGPGNGGGAYQFALGTWENYGGAADEFGVAGPAYQDQIFDNAVAAGGASNWTDYDGC
jgi:hypothetical protein